MRDPKKTAKSCQNLPRAFMTLSTALACGFTAEQAAKQSSVSERTVYRRLNDPAFRSEVERVRDGMVERCSGMLTAAGLEAVKTLLSLLATSNPPATRLGAARAVLEIGMRVREATEIVARLSQLETRIGVPTTAA